MLFASNATSLIQLVRVVDDNDDPVTGLAHDAAGLVVSYKLQAGSAWVSPTLVAGTLGTYVANSWTELGAGIYQWCPPNAAVVAGTSTAVRVVYNANAPLYDTLEPKLPAITAGTGARTVTITVDDGTDPLENATVRLTSGAITYTAATNVQGVATFNVDDATYIVSIARSGHSFAGATIVVNGTETATYSMTATVITPGTGNATTGYLTCLTAALAPEAGVTVSQELLNVAAGESGFGYSGSAVRTCTSAGNGIAQISCIKGATYRFWRGSTATGGVIVTIPQDADTTFELPSLIGR